MASQEEQRDSSSEDEFGVQSPPLTKLISDTLRRYPEGGQILKELIQNADDAGATEVKFLLDHRQHSCNDLMFDNFERFQGPALYTWNNAVFEKSDWQSIGKIGQSRKKDDPIKVGRFGLGFLSVFHLTDLPMIVSKEYLGLIDPHRYCASKSETSPAGVKKTLTEAFIHEGHVSTFNGVFGLSRDTISYKGTLFRFPLRQRDSNSKISPNVYTPEKITENLFETFKHEAPFVLLFLKNVQSISLYEWKHSSSQPEFCFRIGIDECTKDLVKREKDICKDAARTAAGEEASSSQVFVQLYSVTFIEEQNKQQSIPHHWLTVNVVGTTESDGTLTALKTELSILPWVGLAIRLPNQIKCSAHACISSACELTTALKELSPELEGSCVKTHWVDRDSKYTNGRAFCFLPLPIRTELPVNIHGYFAVADNRQSIKWPGDDEKGKEALWNRELLYKVVAPAYALLLACRCELVKYSDTPLPISNTAIVTDAFSAWPLYSEVKKKEIWSELVAPMMENILQLPLLWTPADQGKWVKFDEAYFLPCPNDSTSPPFPQIIAQLFIECNVPVVSLPHDVHETILSCEPLFEVVRSREITPRKFRDSIRQNPSCCSSLTKEDLYPVLEYVISDLVNEPTSYGELAGLLLLPIKGANEAVAFEGQFSSNTKYLFHKSSNDVLDFLPGIDYMIVDPDLPDEVASFLCDVCEEDLFQLKLATAEVIATDLLEESMSTWCNADYSTEIRTPTIEACKVEALLLKLWRWIKVEKPSDLDGLPVVPVRSPTNSELVLYALSDSFKFCAVTGTNDLLLSILRQLDFVVIDNSIVPYAQFPHHFPEATPKLIVQQMETQHATAACVESMTHEEKNFLRSLFAQLRKEDLDNHCECLRSLPIYKAGIGDEIENSLIPIVNQDGQEAFLPPNPAVVSLPRDMIFPSVMLNPSDNVTVKLAKCLGVEELSFSRFCIDHMVPLALKDQRKTKEREDILKWILQVLQVQPQLQEPSLVGYLSNQAFIKTRDGRRMKPTDLYDSDDREFLELFDKESGVFPDREYANFMSILQKLGMKTWKVVKSEPHLLELLLLERAQSLCDTNVSEAVMKSRGKFILATMLNFCKQIRDNNLIYELPFLFAQDRPNLYPAHLEWYSIHSRKYSLKELCLPFFERYTVHHLVGSVLPILSTDYDISHVQSGIPFRKITASNVVNQLAAISSLPCSCSADDLTEMNAIVLSIYNHLLDNEHPRLPQNCVWWQDAEPPQFLSSTKFVVQFPPGLHLEPYFHAIHKSQLRRFKDLLGVKESIDKEGVLSILDQIKSTCDSEERELNTDELNICVSILDWLREKKYTPNGPILMPTTTKHLAAANQCIFDDRNLLERASRTISGKAKSWTFVSEKITSEVAKYFEVTPLSQKVAPSKKLAISFTQAGQHESITRRISHIVRDYETDIDIFKELIQNADDAGATEVKFLLDWRQHPDSALLTDELKHWQGPALIAYNDAKFSEQDFANICKLAGESKKTDTMKTGRFGVGFCATYHLTDLPSFISRRYLTIFDPHTTYLGDRVSPNQPGMRVDLVENQPDLKVYKDQFSPYDGLFDCNVFKLTNDGYQGTLFRFPYRNSYTQNASEIFKQVYDHDQIDKLVASLKQEQENLLLFLRNVQHVTLYELRSGAQHPSEMSKLYSIHCSGGSPVRCKLMRALIPRGQYKTECTKANVRTGRESTEWTISSVHGCQTAMPAVSGVNQDHVEGLLPFAEIALKVERCKATAVSVPTSTEGKLFCFLPMPKFSGLSFHINGFFDVSHDRRSLRATDDKTFGSLWNKHIAEDTLHLAFVNLLQYLASQCKEKNDHFLKAYYELWKFATIHEKVADYLCSQFNATLPTLREKILWSAVRGGTWLSPTEIVVLKDKTMENKPDIVRDATEMLIQNNYNLVDIPEHVFVHLEQSLLTTRRIFNYERFCTDLLFPRISEVPSDVRDRNVIFLLCKLGEHSIGVRQDLQWAKNLINSTPCIPCQSSQTLKRPQELIDCRNSLLASLYAVEEGRFPSEELQQCQEAMRGLCNLGMSSEKLSLDDLEERANTVCQLVDENPETAKERSRNLLWYISKVYALNYSVFKTQEQKTEKKHVQKCLSQVSFLPVLDKPSDIQLPWHGQADTFVCPSRAYLPKHTRLLFTQCSIISLPRDIPVSTVTYLGVKQNEPTIDIVLRHFECIIDNQPQRMDDQTLTYIDETVMAIYSFLKEYLSLNPHYKIKLPHRCVWWNKADPPQFFEPAKFVKKFPTQLPWEPYFYAIYRTPLWDFQKLLGIKHCLSCEDGLSILTQICSTCDSEERKLNDNELSVCVSVLSWLLKENYTPQETILIPTTKGTLKPAQECLFDDRDLFKRASKTIPSKAKRWSFVSQNVTADIAKYFHVPPLSQKVAPSTKLRIAYSSAGQHEKITQRIAHIVRDYGTDIDIFKELIQNADDAGATEVKFLLDWRQHSDSSLFTDELKHWQGPALIAYNNAVFSDQDFDHICEVAGENKRTDPLKTGRFGIGFNATYHLTDLPSFISRRYLTIFDPHTKYLVGRVSLDEPGMRVDLVENQDDLQMYRDQFVPFDRVFGCDIFNLTDGGYKGTLFRFPYRTEFTSKTSDISSEIFTKWRVNKLVDTLKEQKSELLLFLKHVKKVTVYELPKDAKHLSEMTERFSIECSCDHHERRELMITPPDAGSYKTCCTQLTTKGSDGQTSKWLISSAHGHTLPMPGGSDESRKGLLPLAEIALKVEGSKCALKPLQNDGRLFCFLPLPNKSELALHINGFFDIGKDRRNLSKSDDRTFGTLWNEFISEDTLCVAFVKLLENLAQQASLQLLEDGERKKDFLHSYYNLWMFGKAGNLVAQCLSSEFSTKLPMVVEKILWSEVEGGCWLSPQEVYIFSDKILQYSRGITNDAILILLERKYNVVEVPFHVFSKLKTPLQKASKVFNYQRYCTEVFFPNIKEIDPALRDRNIVFLLKKFGTFTATDHEYMWAKELLISTPCIPCQGTSVLRKPTELVDSKKKILANLYDVGEGRFPIETLLQCDKTYYGLKQLGMASLRLKLEDLKERACTVSKLSTCAAYERSKNLLLYISQLFNISHYPYGGFDKRREEIGKVKKCLCGVSFIPVLGKPKDVALPWHGKEGSFISPSKAFAPEHCDLVFTQCDVVSLPDGVYIHELWCLGIHDNKPSVDVVLNHFECVITSLPPPDVLNDNTKEFLDSAMKEVYNFFNILCLKCTSDTEKKTSTLWSSESQIKESEQRPQDLENMKKIADKLTSLNNVIWQDGHLLCVQQVCMHYSFSFYPYICELSVTNKRFDKLFRDVLKVRNEASVEDMVNILAQIKDDHAPDSPVSEKVLNFIESLVRSLAAKVQSTEALNSLQVFLPDDQRIMRPVDQLACDKLNIEWIQDLPAFSESFGDGTCYFINGCITRERAITLGARPLLEAILKEIEDENLLAGTEYGQHEDLCDRLNSILKKYQPDVSIFQEFIQNADDAQATEIAFILDHRKFPDEHLFSHKNEWKELQQTPALCVFNNRKFQESDIIGITKLGRGGKDQSAELIGKFGIGFNVAYHVTDCPSFLSCDENGRPENLCVFDPMLKFVPRASKRSPGKRWKANKIRQGDFPHQFLPYLGEDLPMLAEKYPDCLQGIHEHGHVVFRLPLTRKKVDKKEAGASSTCKNIPSVPLQGEKFEPADIVQLFKDFSQISRDMLLFLNNLKCISAFEIKQDGEHVQYVHHFTTTATIATPYVEQHMQFSSRLKQCMKDIEEDRFPTPYSGSHKVTVVHTEATTEGESCSKEEQWLVQRAISGEGMKLVTLKAGLAQSFRPIGGVATLLSPDEHEYHLFCFLPMPIPSDLPVQINGHFVVDDSRKHLETIKQGGLEQWNVSLMKEVIIPAYIELVVEAKSWMDEVSSGREWYYKLFPGGSELKGELNGLFTQSCFHEKLLKKNPHILLLESADSQRLPQLGTTMWKLLRECYFCVRFECKATNTVARVSTKLRNVFCSLGLPITDAPTHIHRYCSSVDEKYRSDGRIEPSKVCEHLKQISLQDSRCDIIKENIQIVLEYCLLGYSKDEYQSLFSSLFLLAADGSLQRRCLFSSSFSELLPHRSADFVDRKLEASVVGHDLLQAGVIVPLSLNFVASHVKLPSTSQPVDQDVESKLKLVEIFWKYISHTISYSQVSQKHFMLLFRRITVLPTKDNKLFPVCLSKALLDISEPETPLASVMRKLGYSELDFSTINLQSRQDIFQRHVLNNITCTCTSGQGIVDCMKLQRPKKFNVQFTQEEVFSLTFCLSSISKSELSSISQYLLKMPLFKTVDESFVTLSSNSKLLVTPTGMPLAGVHEVQSQTNFVILVPPDQSCQEFYTKVIPYYSSACVSVQEFYRTFLLPNFPHLSDTHIHDHIEYLFSKEELFLNLQAELKCTPFIRHEEKLHLVQDFYDPTVEYFRTFHASKLLPESWRKLSWRHRMVALGLHTKVTCNILLSQAKQFQKTSVALSPRDMRKQSSVLLENVIDLVEKCLDEYRKLTPVVKDFLNEISEVPFIVHSQTPFLETLLECLQLSRKPALSELNSTLVKLSGSVSSKEADLACLCRTVLPSQCDKLLKNSSVRSAVCVEMPLMSKTIVENLVLLSTRVTGSCTRRHTSVIENPMQKLADVFLKHYIYLNKTTLSSDEVAQLKEVMCIMQVRGDLLRLVKPDQLVKTLPSKLNLEPFCYQVAPWMQAYEHFLKALGVPDELKADDYALILTKIHNELEKSKQSLARSSFLHAAISAFKGLIQTLRQDDKVKLTYTDNNTLFLLDESKELVEATKIYDKDVPWHASRLPQDSNTYRYLYKPPRDSSGRRTIPSQLKVTRLSDVLVERICDECKSPDVVCPDEELFEQGKRQEDGRCVFVRELLSTLQSPELHDGFCRVYYHEHQSTPPKSFISRLHTLKKLQVKCINAELKTELLDQGKVIPGTISTHVVHMVDKQCLYISPHSDSYSEETMWKQVSSAIGLFLEGEVKNELLIKCMFEHWPSEISQALDENKVIPFSMKDLKPEERKSIGTVLPLAELSPRDSIIVQNYKCGELVCYLEDDGILTYAEVVDTKPMVDDILEPTIKLRVAQTHVANGDTIDNIEDSSDSDASASVAKQTSEDSSSEDGQSVDQQSTGEVEVLVSPSQVFKILSPSQEALLWENAQTPYADPIILAPIPYTDEDTLKAWITDLYDSKNLQNMSGLVVSMVTIRLIGHMHYQLVIQGLGPRLFTSAVMHIKQIVSMKQLPCTVVNKRHTLHASINSLVDMVFKLSLDSECVESSDSDSDTPTMKSGSSPSHVHLVPSCSGIATAGVTSSGGVSGSTYYIPRSGQGSHLQQATPSGSATATLTGNTSNPTSGRTSQPTRSVPVTPSQPRFSQPRTRRGYRAPQQNRHTRFPTVVQPPPVAATAATPPKPPPTCDKSASAWLEQGKEDFKAAKVLLLREEENKFPALVCFLCHDSVEKCLKGAHYAFCGLNRDLVNISNLVLLAGGLSEECPKEVVAMFKECAMFMNQHENRSRFPNFQTPPCAPAVVYDVDTAKEAFEMVRRLFEELMKNDKLKRLVGDLEQLPKPLFQSTLKSIESGSDSEWPTSWDRMAEDEEVKLSMLDPDSPTECVEYERVADTFLQSLPNVDIMRIERVQNKLLWRKYRNRSETMVNFNNGILREQMLFHGTRTNKPALIYQGDSGFDKRFSRQGLWGEGNYFATNASYSDGYAYHTSQNVRKMFAVWVLTGMSFPSKENSTLRMPPIRDTSRNLPDSTIQRRYDCVTGVTYGTRVYITYENDLAYPAYLITYRHKH